jgi:methylenetetrahydrofolate reductase (NADPH)
MEMHFNQALIDLQTPKQNAPNEEAEFEKFQARYTLFRDEGFVVSITDNPLGRISYTAPETLGSFELPIDPARLVYHLNSFHRKSGDAYQPGRAEAQNEQDLDVFLQHAHSQGVRYLTVISGDGSIRLPRLVPEDLGYDPQAVKTVTSVQLLEYIHKTYPGWFVTGVAFNQYEPQAHEIEKLKRKLGAGASFVITQPCLCGADLPRSREALDEMIGLAAQHGAQPILGLWMSKKFAHLLPECIGYEFDTSHFDPWFNWDMAAQNYPRLQRYYSMVFSADAIREIKARQSRA